MQNMSKRSIRVMVNDNSDLYALAQSNGTIIECFDLPNVVSTSVMFPDGSTFIGIDPFGIDSTATERVCLAHELGHCVTGSFYNIYARCDLREKHERKATKWAIKKLIPLSQLNYAISMGIFEVWDLADYFNVTEEFIKKALSYYIECCYIS